MSVLQDLQRYSHFFLVYFFWQTLQSMSSFTALSLSLLVEALLATLSIIYVIKTTKVGVLSHLFNEKVFTGV